RPKSFAIAHRAIPIKPTVVKKTVLLDTFFRNLLEFFCVPVIRWLQALDIPDKLKEFVDDKSEFLDEIEQ
ncbi:MAG: hypothetical protein HWQ37_11630, partial [Nostoc sp. NMS4]|nr:hypothetical protein [Nostoc sp. NMS4]